MKTKIFFRSLIIVSLFSGLISGCSKVTPDPIINECDVCEACQICEACLYSSDLVLPQVFYMTKINFLQSDLNMIQTSVINPVVAYFTAQGSTVVSVSIDSDNRGSTTKNEFTIEVIASTNDGNADPIYMSFITTKVSDVIPVWVMESE